MKNYFKNLTILILLTNLFNISINSASLVTQPPATGSLATKLKTDPKTGKILEIKPSTYPSTLAPAATKTTPAATMVPLSAIGAGTARGKTRALPLPTPSISAAKTATGKEAPKKEIKVPYKGVKLPEIPKGKEIALKGKEIKSELPALPKSSYQSAYSPITPEGNQFYALVNPEENTVSVFKKNKKIERVKGSPFATGNNPSSVAFSPILNDKLFAAVTNQHDNSVIVYLVDSNSGKFNRMKHSTFNTQERPIKIEFSPITNFGKLFAAIKNAHDTILIYSINKINGNFQKILDSNIRTGSGLGLGDIKFSPIFNNMLFFATLNFFDNTFDLYIVNQSKGKLESIRGSPFKTDLYPTIVTFSPIGENLFILIQDFRGKIINYYSLTLQRNKIGIVTDIIIIPSNEKQYQEAVAKHKELKEKTPGEVVTSTPLPPELAKLVGEYSVS